MTIDKLRATYRNKIIRTQNRVKLGVTPKKPLEELIKGDYQNRTYQEYKNQTRQAFDGRSNGV